jgi:hypothetical protein
MFSEEYTLASKGRTSWRDSFVVRCWRNALCSRVEEIREVLHILRRPGWLLQHRSSGRHDSHSLSTGPWGTPVSASERAGYERRPSNIRTHAGQWLTLSHLLFVVTPRRVSPTVGGRSNQEKLKKINIISAIFIVWRVHNKELQMRACQLYHIWPSLCRMKQLENYWTDSH